MQFESSITHRRQLESGLTITESREIGEGDSGISLVRYSSGELYLFDNGSGMAISSLWGWREANSGQEPAWFLSRTEAVLFGLGCGDILGEPEQVATDGIALTDILIDGDAR